jgi:hypothetical protein
MRKSIILFLIIWIPIIFIYAQDQPKKVSSFSLGLNFSPLGKYEIFQLVREESDPTYSSKSFYSLGISTIFKTKKMVEIESGIYYSYHLMTVDSPDSYYSNYYPDEKIALIELPLNIRFDFPYFYVSTGLLADLDLNNSNRIDNQSGIGLNTSLGISYKFKYGILLYGGPIFYMHNFFPSNGQQLAGMSLKIGISFDSL